VKSGSFRAHLKAPSTPPKTPRVPWESPSWWSIARVLYQDQLHALQEPPIVKPAEAVLGRRRSVALAGPGPVPEILGNQEVGVRLAEGDTGHLRLQHAANFSGRKEVKTRGYEVDLNFTKIHLKGIPAPSKGGIWASVSILEYGASCHDETSAKPVSTTGEAQIYEENVLFLEVLTLPSILEY